MRRLLPRLLPLLILGLAGCTDEPDATPADDDATGDDDTTPPDDDTAPLPPELVLALDEAASRAGDDVGYRLLLVADGVETPVSGALVSDLEPGLAFDEDSLRPTVAGVHTVTATADVSGEARQVSASLEVGPGPADDLDLVLSAPSFAVGGSVTYAVTAADAYGNAVDGGLAAVSGSSPDLTVSGGTVTGTVVGTFQVTASLDGATDHETVAVTEGAPASVELTLDDMALEVGDHTYATVAVWDAHGNPVDAAYTLEVTGGPATLTGDDIEVLGEGWYTFWARIDGTALADSVGPLLVDSTGPVVIIESPDRGATAAEGTGSVWGTATDAASGIVSLTVNGTSVPVSDDGSFSANVPWGFGLNVVEVAAVDGDGNGTTVNRAVLAGDFRAAGASVGGGVLARLNEGPGGIDELEEIGEGLIGSAELDDLIPSPVFSDSYEECVWGFCFTVYSATVYVNNPYIGGTDLQIDPGGDGRLRASLTVSNPSLQWSASGDLAEIGYSGSGSIWADSITVGMALLPSVSGGNIALAVESVWVSSSGFHFDVDSWLYDVLEFFGVDLNSLIQGYMEDALYDAVYDAVPDLLGDALQDLELAYTLSLLSQDYHVLAPPDRVSVDETGLTVSLATTFWPDDRIVSGPGSLYAGYPAPALGGGNGLIAGLSQDFLNQAFEGFWGGGMLHQTFTDEDLGLDVADLALFVPGLTDLSITTEPYLPPVVVPGGGASMLDLGVGDLLVTVWNGAAAPGNEVLQAWVSAIAGLDLVAAGDASFTATLGDAEIWVDVVWPEANTSEAAAYEGLVQMLVPPLLPEVAGALGEIAIPAIAGFTLTGVSAGVAGAGGGYVTLGGDLVSL